MRMILRITVPGRQPRIVREDRLFCALLPAPPSRRWCSFSCALILQVATVILVIQLGDQLQAVRHAEQRARLFYLQTAVIGLSAPLPGPVRDQRQALRTAQTGQRHLAALPLPAAAREAAASERDGTPLHGSLTSQVFTPELSPLRLPPPAIILDAPPDLISFPNPESPVLLASVGYSRSSLAETGITASPVLEWVRPTLGQMFNETEAGNGITASISGRARQISNGFLAFTAKLIRAMAAEKPLLGMPASGPAPVLSALSETALLEEPEAMAWISFPADGTYDIVVMHSAGSAAAPGSSARLTGNPLYSVTLPIEHPLRWALQFATAQPVAAPASAGTISYLSGGPVEAPWPLKAAIPPASSQNWPRRLVLRGVIGADGQWRELRGVEGRGEVSASLIRALGHWKFRPATQGGAPVEVEALLVIEKP